jgi:archaellum component FlaF (FlaF/FlaG flagellin family)
MAGIIEGLELVSDSAVGAVLEADSGTESEQEEEELSAPISIWDDSKVEKYICSTDGWKKWKCLWCQKSFKNWNATKVVAHLSKTRGRDIAVCKANIIGKSHAIFYQNLQDAANKKRKRNYNSKECVLQSIESQQDATVTAISISRREKGQTVVTRNNSNDGRRVLENASVSTMATPSVASTKPPPRSMMQLTLDVEAPKSSNELLLTVAIADLIHSCGLPFSLADDPKLTRIIKLARGVASTYKTPTRQDVAGRLLEFNYNQLQARHFERLKADAATYGLALYGDGATVKRMPLLNILASGAHLTTAVLEIVDCSGTYFAKSCDCSYFLFSN